MAVETFTEVRSLFRLCFLSWVFISLLTCFSDYFPDPLTSSCFPIRLQRRIKLSPPIAVTCHINVIKLLYAFNAYPAVSPPVDEYVASKAIQVSYLKERKYV